MRVFLLALLTGSLWISAWILYSLPVIPPPTEPPTIKEEEEEVKPVEVLSTFAPTLAPTVFIQRYVVLNQSMGNVCNQLHAVGRAFDLAATTNATVRVIGRDFVQLFRNSIDLDYIRAHTSIRFDIQEDGGEMEHSQEVDPGTAVFCGIRNAYPSIRALIRPSAALRKQAEFQLHRLHQLGEDIRVVSVHLRHFEGVCEKGVLRDIEWVAKYTPCHRISKFEVDANRICNVQLDRALSRQIHLEWPDAQYGKLVLFVSTDGQNAENEATFFNETTQKEFKVLHATKSVPNSPMLLDMWISTMAEYYVANPASSCESIVAQWRSILNKPQIAPSGCFAGFQEKPHTSVFDTGACDTYATTLYWKRK